MHTITYECFCPACALVIREQQDIGILARRWQLCEIHRARFVALLRDPYAASTTVYCFLAFVRKIGTK